MDIGFTHLSFFLSSEPNKSVSENSPCLELCIEELGIIREVLIIFGDVQSPSARSDVGKSIRQMKTLLAIRI